MIICDDSTDSRVENMMKPYLFCYLLSFLANLSIVEQYGFVSGNEYLLNDILKDEW